VFHWRHVTRAKCKNYANISKNFQTFYNQFSPSGAITRDQLRRTWIYALMFYFQTSLQHFPTDANDPVIIRPRFEPVIVGIRNTSHYTAKLVEPTTVAWFQLLSFKITMFLFGYALSPFLHQRCMQQPRYFPIHNERSTSSHYEYALQIFQPTITPEATQQYVHLSQTKIDVRQGITAANARVLTPRHSFFTTWQHLLQ
jgi:hypothetical protein